MKRKEIVLIKETRQNEVVKKIMDAISPFLAIRSSDRVAIKINLSGAKEIYANTHYETVDSLIRYLREKYGITQVTVIEGSDGAFFSGKTTWDIFYKFKYKEIEMQGAQLCNLDDLPHDQLLKVETISGPRDVSFCRFPADYLISIIPPKTHNIFPVSLSVPNLIGFVKPEDRVLMFGATTQEMKRINFIHSEKYFQLLQLANRNFVALLKQIQPSLVIIDGLIRNGRQGPDQRQPGISWFCHRLRGRDHGRCPGHACHGFQRRRCALSGPGPQRGLGQRSLAKHNRRRTADGQVPLPAAPAFSKTAQVA